MSGIRGFQAFAVFFCFSSFGQTLQKTASVADCSFQADPDRILSNQARVRREVNDRILKMTQSARAAARPALAADSLPQRNFIDQEIFGKLAQMKVPAAQISTDSEFLRRITLDLTGRIPSSDDVRAFLADTTPGKRDAMIDKLLYSAEFADRWTMWLGDLLQNTATLNSVNFNRNVQGRNAFFAYIQNAVYNEKSFKDMAIETINGHGNNYDAEASARRIFRWPAALPWGRFRTPMTPCWSVPPRHTSA